MHSGQYAFRDRRARKGEFRKLWIQRINAACRLHGMSYSRFIAGLHGAGVEVDRKVLADLAVTDDAAFAALVRAAEQGLEQQAGQLTPASALHQPPRSSGCGASWGAAVRVGTRARSSSRAPACSPRRSPPAWRSRRSTSAPSVAGDAAGRGAPGPGAGARRARAGGDDGVAAAGAGRRAACRRRRAGGPWPAAPLRRGGRRARRPGQRRHRSCASAEAAGAAGVVLTAGSRRPVQPEGGAGVGRRAVPRAGRGRRRRSTRSATSACRLLGARRPPVACPYDEAPLDPPVALVLGNEAHGLPDGARRRRAGLDPARRPGREPQRGHGRDRPVLRGRPPRPHGRRPEVAPRRGLVTPRRCNFARRTARRLPCTADARWIARRAPISVPPGLARGRRAPESLTRPAPRSSSGPGADDRRPPSLTR